MCCGVMLLLLIIYIYMQVLLDILYINLHRICYCYCILAMPCIFSTSTALLLEIFCGFCVKHIYIYLIIIPRIGYETITQSS